MGRLTILSFFAIALIAVGCSSSSAAITSEPELLPDSTTTTALKTTPTTTLPAPTTTTTTTTLPTKVVQPAERPATMAFTRLLNIDISPPDAVPIHWSSSKTGTMVDSGATHEYSYSSSGLVDTSRQVIFFDGVAWERTEGPTWHQIPEDGSTARETADFVDNDELYDWLASSDYEKDAASGDMLWRFDFNIADNAPTDFLLDSMAEKLDTASTELMSAAIWIDPTNMYVVRGEVEGAIPYDAAYGFDLWDFESTDDVVVEFSHTFTYEGFNDPGLSVNTNIQMDRAEPGWYTYRGSDLGVSFELPLEWTMELSTLFDVYLGILPNDGSIWVNELEVFPGETLDDIVDYYSNAAADDEGRVEGSRPTRWVSYELDDIGFREYYILVDDEVWLLTWFYAEVDEETEAQLAQLAQSLEQIEIKSSTET